jgi:hypothetical protein
MSNQFHLTHWENVPYNYSIVQGALFSFTIIYPDLDLSNWSFSGQIRKTFDDATVLADFNFTIPIYGPVEGKLGNYSTITPYLNASQTSLIPVPPKTRSNASDSIKEGSNVWVYDIEAIDPNNSENVLKIISKSYVEVIGEVTR